MCFVNSGYGYVATQGGKCAVAFRPNELTGKEFPCCRQTTNRKAFEEKRSALIKFEIANLRALYDIESDHTGTIATIVEYSGQPEEYIENITYGKGDYVAAMKFEMDPYTDDVKAFYGDMIDNGDIDDTNKELIVEHMDSTIYKAALDTLIERRREQGLLREARCRVCEAQHTRHLTTFPSAPAPWLAGARLFHPISRGLHACHLIQKRELLLRRRQ